ncbi:MAG: radical SAM protein [Polyangiaceae bacterium]
MLPASEADSLPLRVTRSCLWNRCRYCTIYRGQAFSIRSEEEIFADIEWVARLAEAVRCKTGGAIGGTHTTSLDVPSLARSFPTAADGVSRIVVERWLAGNSRRAFLQDADALVCPIQSLVRILKRLRDGLPEVQKVVTFASTRTLLELSRARGSLEALHAAGLNKVLVGVESGSNRVLHAMNKGCTSEEHIEACRCAIEAGLEVGCYVMPGLGGLALTEEHGAATSRVIREIRPHQVLLRMLYCDPTSDLEERRLRGEFRLLEAAEVVQEIRTFLRGIADTTTEIESSYDGNLIPELQGRIDMHAARFDQLCEAFLSLPQATQDAYTVARRIGAVANLAVAQSTPRALDIFVAIAANLRARSGGRLEVGLGGNLLRSKTSH